MWIVWTHFKLCNIVIKKVIFFNGLQNVQTIYGNEYPPANTS